MSKPTKKNASKAQEQSLVAPKKPGEAPEAATARMLFRPAVNAATTANDFRIIKYSEADPGLNELVTELQAQCDAVAKGDLGRAESMLIAQAHSLDAIFTNLARRAYLNLGQYPEAAERYMRLSLKAQSQCRATLETLVTVKNPPVVIAKQANVTSGPQQINNGVAREIQSKPNELLERKDGERLVSGAQGTTGEGDSAMATLGTIDRANVS